MARLSLVLAAPLALCIAVAQPAGGTVYSWRDAAGAAHFTNDEDAVPDRFRSEAERFTAAPVAPAAKAKRSAPRVKVRPKILGYERGLHAGLRAAQSQTRVVAEAIRDAIAALPPVTVAAPPQACGPPPLGFASLGSAYYLPDVHLYDRRLSPHSHFFPSSRPFSSGFFFPRGHFTHGGFIFGSGVYIP